MYFVILTWCKDTRLKEKMNQLETLDMAAFNILIDSHMQAKATTAKPATSNSPVANKQRNTGWGGPNNANSGGRNQVSDAEKKRRQIMKRKCLRCASAFVVPVPIILRTIALLPKTSSVRNATLRDTFLLHVSVVETVACRPKQTLLEKEIRKTACPSWNTNRPTTVRTSLLKQGGH